MRAHFEKKQKVVARHAHLWEPLENEPSFFIRSMFGSKAAYLDGKLMLYFCSKKEPWLGMMICTEEKNHQSLMAEFPELVPHPVLGKWLYLSEEHDEFEHIAVRIVEQSRRRDPRIGIIPSIKRRKISL